MKDETFNTLYEEDINIINLFVNTLYKYICFISIELCDTLIWKETKKKKRKRKKGGGEKEKNRWNDNHLSFEH